jgi:hypothetical protein
MKRWRWPKLSVTGVSLPVIGGGVTWEEKQDDRAARARAERADAFSALWRLAQQAHIGVRNNLDNADRLADVHRQMNALLIERGPALDPADVMLAQGFLSAIDDFVGLLRRLPGEGGARVRADFANTMDQPPMLSSFELLDTANDRMRNYNERLKRRYREIVYGEAT